MLNSPNTEPTSAAMHKAACFTSTVRQETETVIRLNSMYRIQGHHFFAFLSVQTFQLTFNPSYTGCLNPINTLYKWRFSFNNSTLPKQTVFKLLLNAAVFIKSQCCHLFTISCLLKGFESLFTLGLNCFC